MFKCLHGLAPLPLQKCFTRVSHSKNTARANNVNLSLPKVKTESGRKPFAYKGTIIFNNFPNDLKTEQSFLRFKKNCEKH